MKTIQIGDTGSDVTAWQKLLNSKGFVVDTDGVFGKQTLSATIVAQHWAGVTADGIVGPKTLAAVKAKTRTPRPGNVIKHVLRPPGVSPKIVDARNGRAGFPKHKTRKWQQRSAAAIIAKLGHYTGGPGSFLADAKYHVQTDYLDEGGAPAIAYTLGVDVDGTLFVFNDWQSLTWHCDGGHNRDTLGVVFRGGAEGPSLAQRRTLTWLWNQLGAGTFKPFAAEKVWPRLVRSTTHQHVNSTSCPGVKGEAFYRSISPVFNEHLA